MLNLRVILICITLITSLELIGQSNSSALNLANHYVEQGMLDSSLKSLLRAYYNNEATVDDHLPYQIAQQFNLKGDWKNALKYYDIQYYALPYGHQLKNQIRYDKISVYLLQQAFKNAKLELLQINKQTLKDLDKYHFYKGMIYLFNKEYDQGRLALNELTYLDDEAKDALAISIKKLRKSQKDRTKFYQIMSGIIPGMGQTIAGDFKGGINSLALNGALIWLFFDVANRLSYGDAAITVAPWIMRYFVGGVGNAKEAALRKMKRKEVKYTGRILELIESAKLN